MFCTNCGAELSENAKFCICCGEPVPEMILESEPEETIQKAESVAGNVPSLQEQLRQVREEEPALKQEKKQRMSLFQSVLVALLFGVLMLFSVLFAGASIVLQDTLNTGALYDEVCRADFSEADDFYNEISNSIHIEGFTSEVLEKIVENSNMKSQLAFAVSNYSKNLLYGEAEDFLSANDIVKIVEENQDVIYQYTGYKWNEEDTKTLKKEIGRKLDDYESMLDEELKGIGAISLVVSKPFAVVELVFVTISFLALALITRRLNLALMTCSLNLIGGGALILTAAPVRILLSTEKNFMLQIISRAVSSRCFTWGCVFVISGMLVMLVYALIKCFGREVEQ